MSTPHLRLTRIVRFEAAHRLVVEGWDDERNRRVYGKCAREGGHGHNYEVEVTIEGAVDPRTGFLCGRERLDEVLETELTARCDHRDLNRVVDDRVTTGENLALVFHSWLEPALAAAGMRLQRVRVHETPRNGFEARTEVDPSCKS